MGTSESLLEIHLDPGASLHVNLPSFFTIAPTLPCSLCTAHQLLHSSIAHSTTCNRMKRTHSAHRNLRQRYLRPWKLPSPAPRCITLHLNLKPPLSQISTCYNHRSGPDFLAAKESDCNIPSVKPHHTSSVTTISFPRALEPPIRL